MAWQSQDQTRQDTKTSVRTFYRLFDHSIQSLARIWGKRRRRGNNDDDDEWKTCRSIWEIEMETLLPWLWLPTVPISVLILKGRRRKELMNGMKWTKQNSQNFSMTWPIFLWKINGFMFPLWLTLWETFGEYFFFWGYGTFVFNI